MMTEKPMGERITAVEVSLNTHLQSCERMHERNFRILLLILGGLITLALKQFGALG